jgi:hypothetical protein
MQTAEAFTLRPGFTQRRERQPAAETVRRGDEIHPAEAGPAEPVRTIDEGPAKRALRRQEVVDAAPGNAPHTSPNRGQA